MTDPVIGRINPLLASAEDDPCAGTDRTVERVNPLQPGSTPHARGEEVVCGEDKRALALRIGPTVYRLVKPMEVHCEPKDGTCCFTLRGFRPTQPARGATREEAESKWVAAVHSQFQALRMKSLSGLSSGEAVALSELRQSLDVEAYERAELFTVRQIGQIVGLRDTARVVRWIGHDREEIIPLEFAPAEFAGLGVGDRFDAMVQREGTSWRLVEILSMKFVQPQSAEQRATWARRFETSTVARAEEREAEDGA